MIAAKQNTPRLPSRMKVDEIARRLDISDAAVYEMLKAGKIPAERVGNRWFVMREVFDVWIRKFGVHDERTA